MHCPKGLELEEVHDIALRLYLEAAAAVKLSAPNEELSRIARDKAALVQSTHDELIAHIQDCPICQANDGDASVSIGKGRFSAAVVD
jgi:hypothetical protein